MRRRGWIVVALAGALASAFVIQRLAFDERLAFLWPYPPASWIVAQAPLELRVRREAPVVVSFVRDLELDAAPATARLRVRAFRRSGLLVNGTPVLRTPGAGGWKDAVEADVAALLRPGANRIEARVENEKGPPALWLALDLPGTALVSDESWRAVRGDRSVGQAALATRAPPRPVFASAAPLPRLPDVLRRDLLELALLTLTGLLLTLLGTSVARRLARLDPERRARATERALAAVLLVVAAAWVARDAGALRVLPPSTGFDAEGHLEYVEHVRVTGTLALADRGWQTYHPPLYYALAAAVLAGIDTSALDPAAAPALRGLHLVLGLAFLLLVAAALRTLFPGSARKRLFGLLFAGFLPALLYVFQFPGNEVLAITLGAACFFACLRAVRGTAPGFAREVVLGTALGAALLTKQSALLLVPPMLAVVASSAWAAARRGGARRAALSVAAIVVPLLVVCGWHYARVAARFGDPLVANWEPVAGRAWWQDPGFRTPHDFLRLSGAILEPHFAPSDGLVAGLYSSLWADSFVAGVARLAAAPPWLHDLLVLGPLLGVPLTIALVVGFFVTSRGALRRRDPAAALAPALAAVAGLAALWMGVAVPHASMGKATYVMIVAAPLAVLAGEGLDRLAGRSRWRSVLVCTLLVTWALVSFLTYRAAGLR